MIPLEGIFSTLLSALSILLPVLPISGVSEKVVADRLPDRGEKVFDAKFAEQAVSLEMVFYGAFHLGEA
jgi:hypothetical protein